MTSPTLTGFAPSINFAENSINLTPQLLDTSVVFTDPEDDFNGGRLTLSGLLAEDWVAVRHQGNGAGQIGVSGASVSFGGVVIGTLTGGLGTKLGITFNAAATSAAIDALIENLTYLNTSNAPTASRTLVLEVIDAAGGRLNAQPATFTAVTGAANPLDSVVVGVFSAPAFVDIDGDGDMDAVLGSYNGTLRTFANNGAAGFTEKTGAANPFNGVDVGALSRPSFIDIDGDGDMDAVVGEFYGTLRTFANNGAGVFTEQTGAANPFNGVDVVNFSAPSFVDIDGDNDMDAVVGSDSGTLRTFANNGAGVFTERTGGANPFNGVNVFNSSTPSFLDIDGDSDIDAVVGESGGTLRTFVNNGAGVFTELTGAANPFNGVDGGGSSAPTFVDIDRDGVMDAVVGFNGSGLLTFLGTMPQVGITVNVAPQNDAPTLSGLDPAVSFAENLVNATPQLLDANVTFTDPEGNFTASLLTVSGLLAEDRVGVRNEGVGAGQIGLSGSDVTYGGVIIGTVSGGVGGTLSVSFNGAATSAAIDALIQNLTYANVSNLPTASRTLTIDLSDAGGALLNAQLASFAPYVGPNTVIQDILVGNFSAPVFADVDGDGDLDGVVGASDGTLHMLERDGGGVLSEVIGAANPLNGIDAGNFSKPAFGDLDGDGDDDLVLGALDGTLRVFFSNGAGSFTEQFGAANSFNGLDVGGYSAPALADIDGDGDDDLFVGISDGTLRSFRNNGSGVFAELVGTANPFDLLDLGSASSPAFVDFDGDGDMDAIIGLSDGTLRAFANDGSGGFTQRNLAAHPFNGVDVGQFAAPSFVDLDGDRDIDAVFGASNGLLVAYINTIPHATVTVTVTPELDTFTGDSGNNRLTGTIEADLMRGLAGLDTLTGNAGADTLDGGTDADRLVGGADDDWYYVDMTADVVVETSGGVLATGFWLRQAMSSPPVPISRS